MVPKDVAITQLLPHRNGMLLVDEILELDEHQALTRSTVTRDWPLADASGVSPLIFVELAAQTAGLYNGLQLHQQKSNAKGHRGWIVGVKSARFEVDTLPWGAVVTVAARNKLEFEGLREIEAIATMDEGPVAWVALQLMRAEEAQNANVD